jgi:hypothetical protein
MIKFLKRVKIVKNKKRSQLGAIALNDLKKVIAQ